MKKSFKNESNKSGSEALVDNDFVSVFNNPIVRNVFDVHLHDCIDEQKHYKELFNLFRHSDEKDTFVIYINNFGGYVHTGLDLINAMSASKSPIFSVVSGPVYSMAPLIVLQADKIVMEENSGMMFHDYSGGTFGKGSEQKESIVFHKTHFNDAFCRWTNKFLTKKEQQFILEGRDLYLDREQCNLRLERIGKLFKEEEL